MHALLMQQISVHQAANPYDVCLSRKAVGVDLPASTWLSINSLSINSVMLTAEYAGPQAAGCWTREGYTADLPYIMANSSRTGLSHSCSTLSSSAIVL